MGTIDNLSNNLSGKRGVAQVIITVLAILLAAIVWFDLRGQLSTKVDSKLYEADRCSIQAQLKQIQTSLDRLTDMHMDTGTRGQRGDRGEKGEKGNSH